MPTEALGAEAIRSRFPDLDADVGQLDAGAGVVDLAAVKETLTRVLAERGVRVVEGVQPTAIARGEDGFTVTAGAHTLTARSLVVTAGHGTNDVLARLSGCTLRVPIEKDRPSDARYFDPPPEDRHRFTADAMPVVAYLDAGIYCHPIVPGVVDAVKVGYYNPPDVPRGTTTIDSIDAFVGAGAFPALRGMPFDEGPGRRPVRLRPRGRRRLRPRRHPRRGERLRRRRAGAAPATSSPRGSGGCSPSLPSRREPSTTSTASIPPVSRKEPPPMPRSPRTLQQRLTEGVVVGAEGYVFELERRGYIKAGPFVPEVILDAPDALAQLHREFLRAGADVMVALTYYAHRDKLRAVGREGDLEAMNRAAVRIANAVAAEGDALVAGNISNTWSFDPKDPLVSGLVVREQYEEQLGWAVAEGIDFVIAETNDYVGEAVIALEVCQELGLPAMVTFASVQPEIDLRRLRLRRGVPRARRQGRRARRAQLLTRAGDDAAAAGAHPCRRRRAGRGAAGPVPHDAAHARVRVARVRGRAAARSRSSSSRSGSRASRWRTSPAARATSACDYVGICCGGAPHHVRAMAEALGRTPPASRYSPAMELHPVLGGDDPQDTMGGWSAPRGADTVPSSGVHPKDARPE